MEDYLTSPDRKLYITDHHLKAMNSMLVCQTARLGIAEFECECCQDEHIVYQSCKHRFCSICGARETNLWARRLLYTLPDMRYHHVVFTMPKPLRIISKRNGNKLYDLMFRLSAEVVQKWFRRKHDLQTGMLSVLHTSGSDLKYHPHEMALKNRTEKFDNFIVQWKNKNQLSGSTASMMHHLNQMQLAS